MERLYLIRASGGRLARLWQRGENKEGHNDTQDWLPDWFVLSALSGTFTSVVRWIVAMWNGPRVMNHLENNAQGGGVLPSRVSRITLVNLLQPENILLLVLFSLLLVVLLIRRRRHRLGL